MKGGGYKIHYVQFDKLVKGYSEISPVFLWGDENEDKQYTIFVIADQEYITDIDVGIYQRKNDNRTKLKEANAPGHEERIKFSPTETGYYQIEVAPFNFTSSATNNPREILHHYLPGVILQYQKLKLYETYKNIIEYKFFLIHLSIIRSGRKY